MNTYLLLNRRADPKTSTLGTTPGLLKAAKKLSPVAEDALESRGRLMAGSGGGSSDDEAAAKPRRTGSGSPSRARLSAERRGSSDSTARRVKHILDMGGEPTSTSSNTLFGDFVEGHETIMPDAKTT